MQIKKILILLGNPSHVCPTKAEKAEIMMIVGFEMTVERLMTTLCVNLFIRKSENPKGDLQKCNFLLLHMSTLKKAFSRGAICYPVILQEAFIENYTHLLKN
jgi:hypothetical protein